MKKTIVIQKNNGGRVVCLEQITGRITSRGYGVSKYSIVFNSKKEAKDTFKSLSRCLQGVKFITLNDKQARLIKNIKIAQQHYYIDLNRFLEIE